MAAYTWQRFPDANGLTRYLRKLAGVRRSGRGDGFPAIKVSMTAYQPEDHIELVHRIREAVGPRNPDRCPRDLELPGGAAHRAGS